MLRRWRTRAPGILVDGSGAFYAGDGVAPDKGYEGTYPDQPYDLNWRESWFFNNLIISTKDFLIYNKHLCNLYRNRVVSTKTWDAVTGTGKAFHLIATRGGNCIADAAGTKCAVKYNVTESDRTPGTHSDIQAWKVDWEFNDFMGNQVNLYMHCGRPGRPTPTSKVYKTLLGANYARFVGNLNGIYVVGNSRADQGYSYYKPILDVQWEGEDGGAWEWEGTDAGVTARPNGTTIAWNALTNKNTETFYLTFPGDTEKVGCAAGQLARLPNTAKVAELTLAYAANGFTKGEKGIASREGLTWDYVGDGGGEVGPDGTYGLTRNNMTVHLPSDSMATDYPNISLTWLVGGGFDLKANNAQDDTPHACVYIWHKKAPPTGDVEFNFYATMVDNNPSPSTEGVFGLFSPRARGIAAHGADPNGWAPTSWRVSGKNPDGTLKYPTPGSDNIYRSRMNGYRHSFINTGATVANSMQFRIRTYNGVDDGGTQLEPTAPNPVPDTGDSFKFVQGRKYLINVKRIGTVETGTKTSTTDAADVQVWTFDDPALGDAPAGKGVGGWCGFQAALGSACEDRAGAGRAVLPELRWRRPRRPRRPGGPVVAHPGRQPLGQALEPGTGAHLRRLGLDAQDGLLRRHHRRLAPHRIDDGPGHRRPDHPRQPRLLRRLRQHHERLAARLARHDDGRRGQLRGERQDLAGLGQRHQPDRRALRHQRQPGHHRLGDLGRAGAARRLVVRHGPPRLHGHAPLRAQALAAHAAHQSRDEPIQQLSDALQERPRLRQGDGPLHAVLSGRATSTTPATPTTTIHG